MPTIRRPETTLRSAARTGRRSLPCLTAPSLLEGVRAALAEALPTGWPVLPASRLPAVASLRLTGASPLASCGPSGPFVAVLALDEGQLTALVADGVATLVALRRRVTRHGSILALALDARADLKAELDELFGLAHPRSIALDCSPASDGEWRTPGVFRGEGLASVLRDLWCGKLRYKGPDLGVQTAGLETMQRRCWHCGSDLEVVTGIVFPDRIVADWSGSEWMYYGQLLQPSRLEEPASHALQGVIDGWRSQGSSRLTPLRHRHSKTARCSYLGAVCPHCDSLQGEFPLMEERMGHLHDFEARRTGYLAYRSLEIEVTEGLLANLACGFEMNPHCRFLGWRRDDEPEERPGGLIGALRYY